MTEQVVKKIIVVSDQVSHAFRQSVLQILAERGVTAVDAGPQNPDLMADYPDLIRPAVAAVARGEYDAGIAICGSGLGASIAANKVPGVRAVLCDDTFTARMGRAHNDANVLVMGAWVVTPQRASGIIETFLNTAYEGGRHIARLAKLDADFAPPAAPDFSRAQFNFSVALTLRPTLFGPVLFANRLAEGMQTVARAGFRWVELSVRRAADLDDPQLPRLLADNNLSVSALATGQGCIHDGLCLSAVNPEQRKAAIQRMKAIADQAARLGTTMIIGGVRGKLTDAPPAEMQKQRQSTFEAIHECASYAAQINVPVVFEVINRYETNLINTAAEGLEWVKAAGLPNLKLLLDTFHMNIEEADLCTSLRLAGEYLGYVHFADSNRHSPGQGHIDFRAILATLARLNYQGIISAEILPLPDDASAVQRTADHLANILGKPINHT